MLTSALFANDPLLEQIAIDANGQRISKTQNRHDPAVRKVQQALLLWDPGCLPQYGDDGDYGDESAEAVRRFKVEVIGVQGQVYNDVGPQTVLWLDNIAFTHEQNLATAARIAELDQWLTPALSGVFSAVSSAVFNHLLPHAAKVAIVIRNNQFVHAKTWIFDDTVAMVSSANINRRGLEHDSEIGVAFGDIQGVGTARAMREQLWAKHLGANAPAAGSDPVQSLPLWKAPPAGSAISVYDWTIGTDLVPIEPPANLFMSLDQFWEIIDPRCP